MASLSDILDNAHDGAALSTLGREFGLTPAQTQAAVTALLPAISMGLRRSTATVDGLGNLLGMMGQQQLLQDMHDDPETAFAPAGIAAGNDALSVIFGSSDVSRAVVDQAQKFSGVSSGVLKKLLPVLAGILISGLMKSGSTGKAATPAQLPSTGGSLGDILGQIFGRATSSSPGAPVNPGPQFPLPPSQQSPAPTDAGQQPAPDGDLLGSILREFEKGIREGRIKPIVIGGGPVQIPIPRGQPNQIPSAPDSPQMPGDIFGQILRDVFGQSAGGPSRVPQSRPGQSPHMKDLSEMSKQLGVMGGAGAAVFGDHFEAGRDIDQSHVDNIQSVFERYFDTLQR
jgi:Bacterial protein of unknown function (DUF937)